MSSYPLAVPSSRTVCRSCGVTGCTDSLGFLTSAMFSSPGVALISARVTGCENAASALMSTMYQTGLSGVLLGSGCSELGSQAVSSAYPPRTTTALPTTAVGVALEW